MTNLHTVTQDAVNAMVRAKRENGVETSEIRHELFMSMEETEYAPDVEALLVSRFGAMLEAALAAYPANDEPIRLS